MQRAAWTDDRLDDLARGMEAGFERIDRDLLALRTEMREELRAVRSDMKDEIGGLRSEMKDEIGGLRGDVRDEIGGLRGEIDALRILMLRVGSGIVVGLAGTIAAVGATGLT